MFTVSTCRMCGATKPAKIPRVFTCPPCHKREFGERYHANVDGLADKFRARALARFRAVGDSRSHGERMGPKRHARMLLNRAVVAGRVQKEPCAVCGSATVDGHHTDYSKPLEVLWLCRKHHGEAHRLERRGESILSRCNA